MRRALSLAVLVALAAPAVNGGDGSLLLVHDPPDCVVAGRRPRLLACITPASHVARAQVSFRTADDSAWATVPLVSDAPCFSAVLPRPPAGSAALSYFLEAADRATGVVVRTSEYRPRVVADAGACGAGRVAPIATGAERRPGEARAGGGTSPAGADAGGGGKKAVLAVLGGGAAVAGGVIAATAHGADPSPSPPPAPAAVTTPEPNLLLPSPSPSPDPNATPRPRDPNPAPGGPLPPPPTLFPAPTTTPAPPAPTGGCASDRTAPTTRITSPTGSVGRSPVTINASASDNVGVTRVEFWYHVDTLGFLGAADPPRFIGSARQAPYSIQFALPSTCNVLVSFSSRAFDACDNMGVSADMQVLVCTSASFAEPRSVSWTSTLDVKGAEAQLVVNGIAAQLVPGGRSAGTLAVEGAELRVEAQLVRGSSAGTWLFEFTGAGTRPTRLRVLAGEVIGAQDNGVRFRLGGEAGERVVFTLALDP